MDHIHYSTVENEFDELVSILFERPDLTKAEQDSEVVDILYGLYSRAYEEGEQDGRDQGYDEGYDHGLEEGSA